MQFSFRNCKCNLVKHPVGRNYRLEVSERGHRHFATSHGSLTCLYISFTCQLLLHPQSGSQTFRVTCSLARFLLHDVYYHESRNQPVVMETCHDNEKGRNGRNAKGDERTYYDREKSYKLRNDTRYGVVRKTRKSPCGFQKSRNAQSCRTWVRLSHVKCSNLEKKLLCDICILIVQVNIAPL